MSDLNRVTLVGRLTRDPEVRYTSGGMPIVNIGLASNYRQKDSASGEWVEKPNFFDVKLFGPRAESLSPYLATSSRTTRRILSSSGSLFSATYSCNA